MLESVTFCCDIYRKNECVGRLEIIEGRLIKNEVYTSDWHKHPFPRTTEIYHMANALKDRLMPECRWTPEVLAYIGESEYNVYRLLRKTHGIDRDDFWWFKFDDEDITYEDVKVRD